MSLNYYLSNIEDCASVCYILVDEDDDTFQMRSETYSIIFACIPVDFGEITKDNYMDFYFRYRIFCGIKDMDPSFTMDDVERHIGLKVNVSTMTDHAWLTKRVTWFIKTSKQSLAWNKLNAAKETAQN